MSQVEPASRRNGLCLGLIAALMLLLVGGLVFTCARRKPLPSSPATGPGITAASPEYPPVSDFVRSLAFSPDGRVVVTAGIEGGHKKGVGVIKVWDTATGHVKATLSGYAKFVYAVAFAPDNQTLALGQAKEGDFGTASLWDLAAGKSRLAIPAHHESVSALAFSPDGKLLATGALDGVAKLSVCADGKQRALLQGHTSIVSSVSFSADGRLLATGSWDKTIRLWRVRDGRLVGIIHLPWAVRSVALSPDGMTLVAAGDDPAPRVFDTISGAAWGPPLTGHLGAVNAVAYSSDGLLMATGSEDKTVKLWSVPTHQCIATYTGHTAAVNSIAFSPDHLRLASAGNDNTLRLWDVKPTK